MRSPDFEDIEKAAARLEGRAIRTPLIESTALNEMLGGRIFIKAEFLQRTGSFKFRGAWNCISQLPAATRKGGVVAFSSGNHGQGVAAAAQIMGFPALIVVPADTPEIKKLNMRSYGAEIVTYDRATESREEIAGRIASERGAVIVPPFDHADIIAGQGTAGLELCQQAAEHAVRLDAVVINCSGGGLTAGIALAMADRSPETRIYTAEPEGFDDYRRSLISGRREKNPRSSGSICDALLTPQPGELTFSINKPRLAGGLTASEDEVRKAVRLAFENLKLVIEPGGAVSLACVLNQKLETRGQNIAIIASGGNIDAQLFASIITES